MNLENGCGYILDKRGSQNIGVQSLHPEDMVHFKSLRGSSTFNVTYLAHFLADEPVLRLKPFEEGENDEKIPAEPEQEEPDLTKPNIQSLQDNPAKKSPTMFHCQWSSKDQ